MHLNLVVLGGPNENNSIYWLNKLRKYLVKLQVLTCISNSKIKLLSKGHISIKNPLMIISNLKIPTFVSKRDGLVLRTIRNDHEMWIHDKFCPIVVAFYDMKILPYFDLPSRLKRDSAFLGKCGLVINSHDLAGQKVSSRAFCFSCLDK